VIKKLILSCFSIVLLTSTLFAQQENIEIFPAAPYERYIVYEMLTFFWVGIIGLIIIIKTKLKEIEKTQNMGIDKVEKDIPLLD
jgi:hypothetical protein